MRPGAHPPGVVRWPAGQGSHECMVVIFGFGAGSPEDLGEVVACTCPNCHNQVFLHHVRSKKSVRLYFVPVVPYGTDDYLVCPVCSRGLQLNRTQVRHLTAMAGATASFRAGRLGPDQYQARAERFWRQLGTTPGGRVNPARAARPRAPPHHLSPRRHPPRRPQFRRPRRRGWRSCTAWPSCMIRACCPTRRLRPPNSASWTRPRTNPVSGFVSPAPRLWRAAQGAQDPGL